MWLEEDEDVKCGNYDDVDDYTYNFFELYEQHWDTWGGEKNIYIYMYENYTNNRTKQKQNIMKKLHELWCHLLSLSL